MATILTRDGDELGPAVSEACKNGFFMISVFLLVVIVRQQMAQGSYSPELVTALLLGQVAYWGTYLLRRR